MAKLRICISAAILLVMGCGKQRIPDPGIWSKPEEIANSSDSLATSFLVHKWNGSLLTLGGDEGTYAVRVLADDCKSWIAFASVDPSWTQVDVDPRGNRIVVSRATLASDRMDASFSVGSLSPNGEFTARSSGTLSLSKRQLFPNGRPNLEMNEVGKPLQIGFAGGVMEGEGIRIPFCVGAVPVERNGRQTGYRDDLAVSANGVFASSDNGRTWWAEPITTRDSESPILCRTKALYYYFAKAVIGGNGTYGLWSSRSPVESAAWSQPETLNKSVARKLSESLHAIGENDTVHLCWLDARNEKTQFSLTRPRAGNYEVVYCNRKDSDTKWSKDVILSKGIRWSYAPSLSVEVTNLVVAWAGADGMADRTEYGPSDIYYVISKDSGKTWTKPIQVTNGFKSGITSGRPQVALHKGVIHLFYVQGKLKYQQVSAGMVKLNQPPWPILYQQRPFPN